MSVVAWIGESPAWPGRPEFAAEPRFVMPLIEEHVLEVAFMPERWIRRLTVAAAIACTSKLRLRTALEDTGLNPEWGPIPWSEGVVVKAPASTRNLGVVFAPPGTRHSQQLSIYAPEAARHGVWEGLVPGPQYEVDGVVIGGKVHVLLTTVQVWDGYRIASYAPVEDRDVDGIEDAVSEAVLALRLDDSCFCFEMRRAVDGAWKLIDGHARFGEDTRLTPFLGHALWAVEDLARAAVEAA